MFFLQAKYSSLFAKQYAAYVLFCNQALLKF